MTDPILFVVDDDPDTLASLAAALQRRFGADYRILTDRSPASALARLEKARAAAEEVALLVADMWTPEMTGIEWLARARDLFPRAVRCVLVAFGDAPAYPLARRALVLGEINTYLLKPWGHPEERLYPVVSEILGGWARGARPRGAIFRIIGERWARRSHDLRDLSERNAIPYRFYAHDSPEGRRLLHEAGHAGRLPVVIFHDGRLLVDPSDGELARLLGARTEPDADLYDLAIIGAGPSGLAAAVYGAAEGLRTLVLERRALGGQAGMSSMIRNYLGFPRGIGGADLAARAHEQAASLGAEFVFMRSATGLASREAERIVSLTGGGEVRARAVVVATGVSYNRLAVAGVEALVGRGVFYGAATAEAPAFSGHEVFLVGGGNSAGQAAAHLARYAAVVTILVRGPSLSMSDYLVKQIHRTANIQIRFNTEILRAEGGSRLEALALGDVVTGEKETVPASALFVLIGAGPHTEWLAGTVQRDERGYLFTGSSVVRGDGGQPPWPLARAPYLLETSLPGVFAAGDVRCGAPKGVAAAVGEGAITIRSVQEYLNEE